MESNQSIFLENMTQKNSKTLFCIFKMRQTIVSDHNSRDIDNRSPRQVLLRFQGILTGVSTDLVDGMKKKSWTEISCGSPKRLQTVRKR